MASFAAMFAGFTSNSPFHCQSMRLRADQEARFAKSTKPFHMRRRERAIKNGAREVKALLGRAFGRSSAQATLL